MTRTIPAITYVSMIVFLASTGAAQKQKPAPKPPPQPHAKDQQRADPQPGQQVKEDEVPTSDDAVKLGTELVNVLFSAVDRNNHVIADVSQAEVSILEDGRPQQIFAFKRETTLPISVAILLDLSGSQEYTFPQEKMAAGEFLRSIIRPTKDSAAILTFQEDIELVQGLTSRMETLSRAFSEIEFSRRFGPSSSRRQATALYDAIYITADEVLAQEEQERGAWRLNNAARHNTADGRRGQRKQPKAR